MGIPGTTEERKGAVFRFNCQTLRRGSPESWPSEESGPLLWPSRFWNCDYRTNGQSQSRHEGHGTQGLQNRDAISTSRGGYCSCSTHSNAGMFCTADQCVKKDLRHVLRHSAKMLT